MGRRGVLTALCDAGVDGLSPEAEVAVAAYRAAAADLPGRLAGCASGLELAAEGYAQDVAVAAEVDGSGVVPVLRAGVFVDGS